MTVPRDSPTNGRRESRETSLPTARALDERPGQGPFPAPGVDGVQGPPDPDGDTPVTPPAPQPLTLADMLIDAGLLAPEQVDKAQETAKREGRPLWRVLVRDGLVFSRDLAILTAVYLGVTMLDLRSQGIEPEAVALLPEEVARRYVALPLEKRGSLLTVAVPDPTDLQALQDISVRSGCAVEPVVATPEDIQEHIDIAYRRAQEVQAAGKEGTAPPRGARGYPVASPAQVIDMLVQKALQDRASDIHIVPGEDAVRIRFRIDGILHDVMPLPLDLHPSLLSRLKVMSGMNIAERRRPQDGHFTFEGQNQRVDVRVAVSNTVLGEMAVLRLLDKRFTLLGLDQLGMSPHALERYRRLLRLPYGMLIVCGPTGAGKSTTLYASILHMERREQNVISIEDPVEYRISGVNQMQVHPEAGITFATQLRSILRLDPNVIMVGEIRDQETAVIATQAALTGHLVLTSLHANDSVSALLRLRDLGVAPYLIASAVAGIAAQRMVRVVCNGCKTLIPRPLAEQQAYAAEVGEKRREFFYGSGCNLCAHTGYRGRTGVFEVLVMSDGLRQRFLADEPRSSLWEQALQEGMVPLRREGMLKVKQGITTPYEVMRVLANLD
ncbi:MAG: GspE/PulE family protein [Dehalococcoidia bacterium]